MRADRLLAIMLHLQMQQKMTAKQLAEALGVTKRTSLRDIEALSAAGVPVYTQSGQGGGIGLVENYRLSLTGLNESEVRALFLAGNAKLLSDIGLAAASESLLLKFLSTLPSLHQQVVEHLRQRMLVDSTWWIDDKAPACLTDLLHAVNHDQCLHVIYQHHDGEVVERVLEPYGLVAKAGTWYLIARRDGEFRIYRASRFHQIAIQDATFQRQADFDLEHFWRTHMQSFFESLLQYRFTLKIHPHRKNFVHRYSTGRYEVIEAADADGWFTARFEAEAVEPAMMFVFGLGRDVVVIEPQELIDAMLSRSNEILSSL